MRGMGDAREATSLSQGHERVLDRSSSLSALGLIGAPKSARGATSQARFTRFITQKRLHDLTSTESDSEPSIL